MRAISKLSLPLAAVVISLLGSFSSIFTATPKAYADNHLDATKYPALEIEVSPLDEDLLAYVNNIDPSKPEFQGIKNLLDYYNSRSCPAGGPINCPNKDILSDADFTSLWQRLYLTYGFTFGFQLNFAAQLTDQLTKNDIGNLDVKNRNLYEGLVAVYQETDTAKITQDLHDLDHTDQIMKDNLMSTRVILKIMELEYKKRGEKSDDAALAKDVYDSAEGKNILNHSAQLLKAQGLESAMANNTSLTFDGNGGAVYGSLNDLYQDELKVEALIGAGVTNPSSFKSTAIAFAHTADSTSTTGATLGKERCGDPRTGLQDIFTSYLLDRATCISVDSFINFTNYLLQSAADLLASTSGIPRGTASNVSSFSNILPSEISTPYQVLMVSDDNALGKAVRAGYNAVLGSLDIVIILSLLSLAIINILQIQVSNYSIKKLLPGILIGTIAAYSSFFIIRASLEISSQVAGSFFQFQQSSTGTHAVFLKDGVASNGAPAPNIESFVVSFASVRDGEGVVKFVNDDGTYSMNRIFQQGILNLFVLAAAILIYILAFLLAARAIVFTLAIPLAPLAFFAAFFPPLNFAWKRWWKLVSGWILMPVVAMFWIWLAFIFFAAVNNSSVGATGHSQGLVGYIIMYLAGMGFLYAAVKTPFSMAGEAKLLMDKWGGIGKNAALRYTPAGAAVRGLNKFNTLNSAKEKSLTQGDVFKNRVVRKYGGDTVNRAFERQEIKFNKDEERQKEFSTRVKNEAEVQLVKGVLQTAAEALAEKLEGTGLEKFGQTVQKTALGFDKFGQALGKINPAYEKYAVTATDTKQLQLDNKRIADRTTNEVEGLRLKNTSYQRRSEWLRDTAESAEEFASEAGLKSEQHFIQGGLDAQTKEFLDLYKQLDDGKTLSKTDQEKLAGLVDVVVQDSTQRGQIKGWVTANVIPPPSRGTASAPGAVKAFRNSELTAKLTALSRRETKAKTAASKAGVEKVLKDAEYDYNGKVVFQKANDDEIRKLLNDNNIFDATLDGEDKRARLINLVEQRVPEGEDPAGVPSDDLLRYARDNGVNAATLTATHRDELAKLVGSTEARTVDNKLQRDMIDNRAEDSYNTGTTGKVNNYWKYGKGGESLAAVKPADAKKYAFALARHYGALAKDPVASNKLILQIAGAHKGIEQRENLPANIAGMKNMLDKVMGLRGEGPIIDNLQTRLSGLMTYSLPGAKSPKTENIVQFLTDFEANIGAMNEQEIRNFVSQYRNSKAVEEIGANLLSNSPSDIITTSVP